jgi:hypothetical protein
MCIWSVVFCRKTWTKRMESQQVQRSKWGVPFVFKCMMKSLPKVARTEVLQRNIPKDWCIKDRTLCEKTLYLVREDDIAKMMQLKGVKCKMSKGPAGAKGRPNWVGMDLVRSAQAGWPGPFPWWFGPPFIEREDDATLSTWGGTVIHRGRAIRLRGHPQARGEGEERDHLQEGSLESKEATTSGRRCQSPATTPPEEKEDTVGSVTMINGAMLSALMG